MNRKRRWLWLLAGAGALFVAYLGVLTWLAPRMLERFRENSPLPFDYRSARSVWPVGVEVEDLEVPDPAGDEDFLLRVPKAVFRVPWWGPWVRPIPVVVTLDRPHLKVTSENMTWLMEDIWADIGRRWKGASAEWVTPPSVEESEEEDGGYEEEEGPAPLPFLPLGLQVSHATLEAIDQETRAGQPVFVIDRADLSLAVKGAGIWPAIRLAGRGDFVTLEEETIGLLEVEVELRPLAKNLRGRIRMRHERLGDFHNLYQYAPRPVFIDNGIADFRLQFEVTQGRRVDLTAGCQVQNLDLDGTVEGGVSWADIMHAVEDDQRRYGWEVHVQGALDDPTFKPHDTILNAVEWDMKERAAARGLRIDGQMFFYEDTPDAEEELTPESPPLF